jgi:hypothetical protein
MLELIIGDYFSKKRNEKGANNEKAYFIFSIIKLNLKTAFTY